MNKPDLGEIGDLIEGMSLSERLLATLIYFDIFDMALGEDDLNRLLLGEKKTTLEIRNANDNLREKISRAAGKTALKGREVLLAEHEIQKKKSYDLYKKVERWSWLFRNFPFVKLVAVCNYLPLGVVDEQSDIDIFVVTKKGRIFLARVIMTVWLHLLGLRRHGEKVQKRFCLSFYVSEDSLRMDEILLPNDIYFAYWMIALYPVYGDRKIWEELELTNNFWVNKYLNGVRRIDKVFLDGKSWFGKFSEWLFGGRMGDFFEKKLKEFFQKRYAAKKWPDNASIIVDEKRLKYHNNDRRAFFRDEWLKRLERYGLLK